MECMMRFVITGRMEQGLWRWRYGVPAIAKGHLRSSSLEKAYFKGIFTGIPVALGLGEDNGEGRPSPRCSKKERTMKNFTRIWVALTALLTFTGMGAIAETAKPKSSGNQLMKNQTHWYEKAATTVGTVPEVTSKTGTLLALQPGSVLYLEGESTLHPYQMNANALLGSAEVKAAASALKDDAALLKALDKAGSMTLVVPLKDLKSRESGLDDNAYKALKSADNPEIRFVLGKAKVKGQALTASGKLTIAGVAVPIDLKADVTVKDGKVRIQGTHVVKMSDHQVTPPSISLLVTAIKCSNEVTVHYDVVFAAKK
jgi:polyisoprenoid-binding protein YceI